MKMKFHKLYSSLKNTVSDLVKKKKSKLKRKINQRGLTAERWLTTRQVNIFLVRFQVKTDQATQLKKGKNKIRPYLCQMQSNEGLFPEWL